MKKKKEIRFFGSKELERLLPVSKKLSKFNSQIVFLIKQQFFALLPTQYSINTLQVNSICVVRGNNPYQLTILVKQQYATTFSSLLCANFYFSVLVLYHRSIAILLMQFKQRTWHFVIMNTFQLKTGHASLTQIQLKFYFIHYLLIFEENILQINFQNIF